MELGVSKKHFHVEAAPSNKVEVFAPAPPSILGSFSGFGHDTLKSRHQVKHKKPVKETFQQAESRPGYSSDFSSSPYRHIFPQPFKQPDNLGQAYFFQASLSPPPRDSGINLVPPPSKGLAPNSYYLQFDQQTRAKPTTSSFSPYLRQHLPSYGAPDYYKVPSPAPSDPYRFYTPEPHSKYSSRPTNGQSRPPGVDYFGNNPFGDIHLNTHKPEVKPAKDIFEQLSPLGRPFQSTTIDPPRYNSQSNDYSSLAPIDFYSTSGSVIRQTTPKPFRPSPLISDEFPLTERPSVFVTPETSPPPRKIYPIPVTTLDIPSRDENFNTPLVSTYQSVPKTQQYYEDATNKPVTTTFYKRPEVEVSSNGQNFFQSTPFLPTPATDPFVSEVGPTDLATPSPETNEVHKPSRTRTSRPRYRKKKPIRKPEVDSFDDTTPGNKFQQPISEYSILHENPKVSSYDTIHSTFDSEREHESETEKVRFEEKQKRRRPSKPNNYYSSSTFTNTESDIQETPTVFNLLPEENHDERIPSKSNNYYSSSTFTNIDSDVQDIPTSFNGLADSDQRKRRPSNPSGFYSSSTFTNTETDVQENPTAYSTLAQEDEIKTIIPSTSTTGFDDNQQKRRKKPTNRIRGPSRHGSGRSTTTTTTEPPQELSREVFPHTEYRPVKETFPTENYPFSGLAFNEYGHVMLQHNDESSSADYNGNTVFPTQLNNEYRTNYHEVVTTTTQEPTTTSTTTTTAAPETTTSSTTTSKARIRNKYNYNNTRPRFSVKNYRERLSKATSTTETPKEEVEEQREISRTRPTRLRGNYRHSENQEEQTETSTRRAFKPSYTGQRHAYRTTSTTPSPLQLENPTTTERANTFKPNSQRRPSSNKYYSRYRTSTEGPTAAGEQPSTEKLPQRPKGVFSAKKRRPFPLRTRVDPTKPSDEEDQLEALPDNAANDLDLEQYITKKSDHVATTTLMTSSEEADWNTPSSARPETPTSDAIDHGDITKKIADLTSSPSNSFDSSGFFKGVSPSSRRTVSHITLATEDPILPIEAFFSSSLNRNNDSR